MYLKSIELYGFKSFADRTKIELNENITCIVGPNGSGKSNITDAIRWVLGEQSSANLRGSKMQDVIFAGTNNRRALGLCEVIITFDNTSNFLGLDYSEVEVKRKLYKNGDSEYYINNSSCRLKDVRELFMDTGIGRDGYSFIGQGRIDAILNSKPVDRRAIFEEASGISKFKSQKFDTERKLKNTKDNLVRLSDLLVEIKSQKDIYKIEAEKAERYNEIYYKILEADVINSSIELFEIKSNIRENLKNKNYILNSKNKAEKKLESHKADYKKLRDKLEEIEFKINNIQIENVENVRLEKDLSNSISLNNEKINSYLRALDDANLRIDYKKDDVKHNEEEILSVNQALSEIKNNKNLIEKNNENLENSIKNLNIELEEFNKNNEDLSSNISKYQEQLSNCNVKIDTLYSLNIERETNKARITTSFLNLEKNKVDLLNHLSNLKIDINSKKEKYNETKEKNEILINKLKEYRIIIQNKENEYRKLEGEINNKKLRLSTLETLEESYEGYNKSIRDFFKYIKVKNIKIKELHDTVANVIQVPPKYEKAISTALGSNTQNLIVDTFSSAQEIISLLRKENLGRITFLPLDNIKSYKKSIKINHKGFIGFASNLIKYNSIYDELIENILGNIAVTINLDCAKEIYDSGIKNIRIVTLEGDVLNPGGSVSGGSIIMSGNIFNRKNELNILLNGIIADENKLDLLSKSIEMDSIELGKLDSSNLETNELLLKFSGEINNLEKKLIELNLNNANTISNISNYENEIADYEKAIIESNFEIEKLLMEKENLKEMIEKYRNNLSDRASIKNEILYELNLITEKLNSEKLKLANLDNEIVFINKNLDRLVKDKNEAINNIEDLNNEIIEINTFIENLKKENTTLNNDLNVIIQVNGSFGGKFKNLTSEKKLLNSDYIKISNEINELNEHVLELEKKIYYIENKLDGYYEKVDYLINNIGESYNLSLIDLDDINIQIEKTLSKSYVKKLKQELSSLGNVNLGAIKSYNEISDRYNFTEEQYLDLTETEEKLRKLIREIEITMEEKFFESFKEINKNFNRIFKFLFEGGMAELIIEEADDINEAGIDIIAQLPGKKRQILNAMSGGERSMTTVALLFALLETKPAPFCLLDEVDAALDEANIKRFLSYLKNLKDIQFAIITHRKTTMTAANYIYGVTMEEPGISKIISLKFDGRKNEDVQVV